MVIFLLRITYEQCTYVRDSTPNILITKLHPRKNRKGKRRNWQKELFNGH